MPKIIPDEEHAFMIKTVKIMIKNGVKKNAILDTIVEEFGYKSRRSASCACTMAGVVFPPSSITKRKINKYLYDDKTARLDRKFKISDAPVPQDKPNLFEQAAALVPGASYDRFTGECRVGRAPVTGIRLMQMAGMELPQ